MATSRTHHADTDSCPDCGGPTTTTNTETACQDCGLVVDETPIDHGREWRAFSNAERQAKKHDHQANPNREDRGLGTDIGFHNERDHDDQRREQLHNHARTGSKKDRSRGYATGEIHRIASALETGDDIRDQAKQLFRTYHENDECIGRDLDTVAAACVYVVLRVHQRGRSPCDVASVARTTEKSLSREQKHVVDALGVKVPPPSPETRIRVVASDAGVSDSALEDALESLENMDDSKVYSGSPSTLAAALLYQHDEFVTQDTLSTAAGVSPVGMRNRLND